MRAPMVLERPPQAILLPHLIFSLVRRLFISLFSIIYLPTSPVKRLEWSVPQSYCESHRTPTPTSLLYFSQYLLYIHFFSIALFFHILPLFIRFFVLCFLSEFVTYLFILFFVLDDTAFTVRWLLFCIFNFRNMK